MKRLIKNLIDHAVQDSWAESQDPQTADTWREEYRKELKKVMSVVKVAEDSMIFIRQLAIMLLPKKPNIKSIQQSVMTLCKDMESWERENSTTLIDKPKPKARRSKGS